MAPPTPSYPPRVCGVTPLSHPSGVSLVVPNGRRARALRPAARHQDFVSRHARLTGYAPCVVERRSTFPQRAGGG